MPVGLALHNQDGTTEELLAQIQPGSADGGGELPRPPFGYLLRNLIFS